MSRPWDNDNCETVRACYSVYTVPVAAALWCGVPEDDVQDELRRALPVGPNALGQAILRHPYLRCLEPRIRAIHRAIDSGELAKCREDGRKTDEHVAYGRRHVYGLDLKEWAKGIAPTERPQFLFDDVERDAHTAISLAAYQTLQATHDAKEHRLAQAQDRIKLIEAKRTEIEQERDSLRVMVDSLSLQLKEAGVPGERSETAYKNMIAALYEYIQGLVPGIDKHPSFSGVTGMAQTLENHYRGYGGLSHSNLTRKLPEALRHLHGQS